ncbi:RNA polymerase sigma factor [Chloroflexota bacterium]
MQFFRNDKYEDTRSSEERKTGHDPDVKELVRKAINDDTEAFGELYVVYVEKIYRYVFLHYRNKTFAEDVTEEVFIKAWKAIDTCRGREDTFESWLYRIARNHLIDEIRKLKRRPSIDTDIIEVFTHNESNVASYLEQQELMTFIDKLPASQRQVVLLKFIQGLNNEEISRVMDKSQGAVRILQMRALENLRNRLAGE